MKTFFEVASGWSTLAICIRLGFAMFTGIIIGIDRGMKRRGAGIKTHTLVCVGSALVMITAEYMYHQFPQGRTDIARLGAQVISGVGFLGVGCIMVTGKNQIRGLTTAAGLWTCACVGLASGIGFLEGAMIALILVFITFKCFTRADNIIHNRAKVMDLYVEFNTTKDVAGFIAILRRKNYKMASFDLQKNKIKGEGPTALLTLEVPDMDQKHAIIEELRELPFVAYVEVL